jgi:hypothetical protein
MTGMSRSESSLRKRFSSPKPSRRGIMMSETMRSGRARRAAASACSPSATASTTHAGDNSWRRYARISSLSSARSTRAPASLSICAFDTGCSVSVGNAAACCAASDGIQRNASCTKACAPVAVETSTRDEVIRSAGRCAVPNGSFTRNVAPLPGSLSAQTVPPCSFTSSCTSASPMPEPS